MTPPLLLLDDGTQLDEVAARLREAGHRVTTSWLLPPEPWDLTDQRLICCGVVADAAAARAAVLAAARGAGIVVAMGSDGSLGAAVLADLGRIGPIKRRRRATSALTDEQRRLLTLLADGAAVPDAARTLLMSPRTAERRLAGARRVLGVRSTAEAVVRFVDEEGIRR